jgi:hypothetical protein
MGWLRRTGTVVLVGVLAAGGSRGRAQDPPADPPTTRATPGEGLPAEAPEVPDWLRPRETPIADSIEPAVEEYFSTHFAPCGATATAVPCFPVTLEVKGRQYSVRETLDHLQFDNRPVPGAPPTAAEMIQHGANPHPTSASVGFDPKAITCKTKQLLQKIQGKSRKYYLYRLWDETGERAVLRDRPLGPGELGGSPHVHYVPLGEFGDECEAIKAYRLSTHEVRLRREAESLERADEPEVELRSDPDTE